MTDNLIDPSLAKLLDETNEIVPISIKNFDFDIKADDLYLVGDAFLDEKGLNGHHLESANNFYANGIKQIITEGFDIRKDIINKRIATAEDKSIERIHCEVKFTDVRIEPPTTLNYVTGKEVMLMPKTALLRDKTYSGPLYIGCEIKATAYLKNGTPIERVDHVKDFRTAKVPIIKGSIMCNTYGKTAEALMQMGEDPSDPGGYFIVKSEWAVDCTESTTFNQEKIYINEGYGKSRVRSDYISKPGDTYQNSEMIILIFNTDNTFTVEISRDKLMNVKIPFYLLFRAMGWSSDKEMMDWIVFDYTAESNKAILNHVIDALDAKYDKVSYRDVYNQVEALEAIVDLVPEENFKYLDLKNKPENYTNAINDILRIFDTHFLPHIGLTSDSRHNKLKFLALLIRKILMVYLRHIPQTDRDSYRIKRIHAAGDNYAKTFKTLFNQTVAMPIKKQMNKVFGSTPFSQVNLANLVRSAIYVEDFERLIVQTIISGNKSSLKLKRRTVTNRFMAQQLNRKNQLNMYATMRQISSTSADSAKQSERAAEMRRVHMSALGYVCVVHSPPEGEKVGINKQMAIFASIAPASSSEVMKKLILSDTSVIPEAIPTPLEISRNNYARVYVNGHLIAYTKDSISLVNKYRLKRRMLEINPYTTVYWDNTQNEVQFFVDAGRMTRPLLIVYNTQRDASVFKAGSKPTESKTEGKGETKSPKSSKKKKSIGPKQRPVLEVFQEATGEADPTTDTIADVIETDPVGNISVKLNAKVSGYAKPKRRIKTGSAESFQQGLGITQQDIIDLYCKKKGIYDLVREQKVEFITPEEQQNCYICPNFKTLKADQNNEFHEYTHCDIPQAILGITALTAPFGNHNQAPRVTYQTSQSKQTCGFYAGNWPFRIDKETFLQYIAEMPLIRTALNKYIYPNGNNCMVAMMCYTGMNQEDSLIVSKAAIERGLFDGSKFTFYKTEIEQKEKLGNPDVTKTEGIKSANYSKLVNGIVERGTHIHEDDVLVGKYMSVPKGTGREAKSVYIDRSIVYKDSEEAIVQNVVIDRNEDAVRFAKVGLRKIRPVAIGDKFCLLPTAEVLTDVGWVKLKDIDTVRHNVLTLDSTDTYYSSISDLHSFHYTANDAPMFMCEYDSGVLVCTPHHRLYVKFEGRKDYCLAYAKDCVGRKFCFKTQNLSTGESLDTSLVSIIAYQPYNGEVMCIEVPHTHLFYCRNNEHSEPVWTGNSSRSGQKGIAALLMRQADLPVNAAGESPDIIFNAHGIPSRMTCAQLIESLVGNVCALKGTHFDGTMFKDNDIESFAEILSQYGYNRYGYDRFINGMTGEFIDTLVFFGPTYYQRLQKFVSDAEYSVRHALTDAVTNQPLDGQASSGGLRIGEMERDVICSHGSMRALGEKFRQHSDIYNEYICRCGKPAIVNHREKIYKCKACKDNADITCIPNTWTSKLFFQELVSCNVGIRRIPRPFVYETQDSLTREQTRIENYDEATIKKLSTYVEDTIDDANTAVDSDE